MSYRFLSNTDMLYSKGFTRFYHEGYRFLSNTDMLYSLFPP